MGGLAVGGSVVCVWKCVSKLRGWQFGWVEVGGGWNLFFFGSWQCGRGGMTVELAGEVPVSGLACCSVRCVW